MTRCPSCNGYLLYERELADTAARLKCTACGWMLSDPNFRKEAPRYFPADAVDKRLEFRQEHPGFDLYEPKSAACQLKISVNYLKRSLRDDPSAPVIVGRGLIACNTPALQQWWDSKKHYGREASEASLSIVTSAGGAQSSVKAHEPRAVDFYLP